MLQRIAKALVVGIAPAACGADLRVKVDRFQQTIIAVEGSGNIKPDVDQHLATSLRAHLPDDADKDWG